MYAKGILRTSSRYYPPSPFCLKPNFFCVCLNYGVQLDKIWGFYVKGASAPTDFKSVLDFIPSFNSAIVIEEIIVKQQKLK